MQRLIQSFTIALCFFVAACSTSGGSKSSSDARGLASRSGGSPVLERIRSRGSIRVGMTGNQPPLNALDKNGQIIGLEPDIAAMFASSIGYEVEIVQVDFPDLLNKLDAGQIDMVMSGVTITPDRNMSVAFVGPYFVSGKSVLTSARAATELDETGELNDPSVRLAALAGSTSEIFVNEILPKAQLKRVTNYDEAVAMVKTDMIDALIADFPFCVVTVMETADESLVTLKSPFTFEPLGIALPAGDPLFVNLVQNFLTTMEGTGNLLKLKAKWFSEDKWLGDVPEENRGPSAPPGTSAFNSQEPGAPLG
jgi:polar amino acid transport system substrate-binding protein